MDRVIDPVSVRLFGTFDVARDGALLAGFASNKVRALLAYLLIEAGRPILREALASLLWPDQPAERAAHSLRQALHSLSRTLGDGDAAEPLLLTDRFSVQISPAQRPLTDVDVFAGLLAACRTHRHRRAETCRPCLRRLTEAVALYRGPFLAGLRLDDADPFETWAAAYAEQVQQQAQDALATLAAACERRGDVEQAMACARRQIELEPWREDAHRQLMRLLARSGRRAEALRQYRLCARILDRELGVAPDEETQALFRQIQSGGALLPPAPAAAPVCNLPARLTSFIGRETALAELQDLLSVERLVTLIGPGGAGKTRLALELAAETAPDYPDGVWLVELSGLADPALVPTAVADALGVRERADRPAAETLAAELRGQRLLLLLDNCEHLLDACAGLAERLLRACPDLCVLATSRERLGLAGETVYGLPPLELPPEPLAEAASDRPAASRPAAVRLFVERAAVAQPGFQLTSANAEAVAELCRRLDGLPLALEIVAASLRALPLELILQDARGEAGALAELRLRSGEPRHNTLRDVVDWSYARLPAEERALFARLAVFSGGWTAASAEAVAGGEAMDGGTMLPLLAALVEKSLVVLDPAAAGGPRFMLLETIRAYAREKLAERGALRAVERCHAVHFLALAEQAVTDGIPHDSERFRRLEREQYNLRAALDWAEANGAVDVLLRLSAALSRFWYLDGHMAEGRDRLDRALARSDLRQATADSALGRARAAALLVAGETARRQRDFAAAQTWLDEALLLHRQLGDARGAGESLRALACLAFWQDDRETARARYEEFLAIERDAGDPEGLVAALHELGHYLDYAGDGMAARGLQTEALILARQLGHTRDIAYILAVLGNIALSQGEPERAAGPLRESLALIAALQGHIWIPYLLESYGWLAVETGRPAEAVKPAAAAQAIREREGLTAAPAQLARRDRWLARAAEALGEADVRATAAWRAGLALSVDQAIALMRQLAGMLPSQSASI